MKYLKASKKTKVEAESLVTVHTHTHTGSLINKKSYIFLRNNKIYNKKNLAKSTGITMISLIVTIIVLLILAGISVATITGNNGIIKQSKSAKENTEISSEKEVIQKAVIETIGKDKRGALNKDALKKQLDISEKDKTNLYDDEENIIVEFKESKRIYSVDKDGNVNQENENILSQDKTPGIMDGTGTKDDPYVIMSIEDLVECSKEASEGKLTNVYINLGRNLNFNSELSYCDVDTKEYNEFLGITDNVGIKEALTNTKYNGFKPIEGIKESSFQGNDYTIKNLWEHVNNNSGFFTNSQIEILNLTLTGNIVCDGDYAGGLISDSQVGLSRKIDNCKSYVNIKSNGLNTAGILASMWGIEINNCINYGNINGGNTVAGITNYWGKLTNCINYGNIKGTAYVAGISTCYSTVIDCKNYGEIEGGDYVGGIVSKITSNNIEGVVNYGKVKGNLYVGGIIALLANRVAELVNLVNYADVEGTTNVGGIAGGITDLGLLTNSVNFGNAKGKECVAGIAGRIEYTQGEQNEIYNCYTVGNIEGTTNVSALVGAKTGYGIHYLKYCYWKKELNLEYGTATVPTTWRRIKK